MSSGLVNFRGVYTWLLNVRPRFTGDYTLPKGGTVGIVLLSIHRSEKYWPDPLKFDPDRFLPEEVAKRHPYCYLPFSGGPRNCIGIPLSMTIRTFKW